MKVRLIRDVASPGAWNMAVDEALLEAANAGAEPTLRIYRWSEPTLSLGYFQNYEDRLGHPASLHCPLVRRSSGGGAILHDCEWTYSFAWGVADRVSASVQKLVRSFHGALLQALVSFQIAAASCESELLESGAEPFLCFQRRASGDVMLGSYKICGSAQRRSKQAVLQHGSILLAKSDFAPELPGIKELVAFSPSPDSLLERWLSWVASSLAFELAPGELTAQERCTATELVDGKHRNSKWLRRR